MKYTIQMDAGKWSATDDTFVDLQESAAGFGDTPSEAIADLLKLPKAPVAARGTNVASLLHGIQRNTNIGTTSVGPCIRGCGNKYARGARVCYDCYRDDLSELVGHDLAESYTSTLRNLRDIEYKIHGAVEDKQDR